MAKFCGNCGAKLDEQAKVCGNCGTPVEKLSTAEKPSNMEKTSKEYLKPAENQSKRKKSKRIPVLCGCLVVLICAGIALMQILPSATGYKKLLKKVMKAYEEYDIDTLLDNSSDMFYYADADFADTYFEGSVGRSLDAFEAAVGHSYQMRYVVSDDYELAERKKSEMLDAIASSYPEFDVGIIENVRMLEVTVTAENDEESTEQVIEVALTKEEGKWKLLYLVQVG